MKNANKILNLLTAFIAVIGACAAVLVCFIVIYTNINGGFSANGNKSSSQSIDVVQIDNNMEDSTAIPVSAKQETDAPTDSHEDAVTTDTTNYVENVIRDNASANQNENSAETLGQKNALGSAKNYLSIMNFSYLGLIDQLEFEKYSHEDAVYAADNCGADWNEQALKSAKDYISTLPFSYKGLIGQLEFEKFTSEQATYGANNCGADWNEQASKSAKTYLSLMSFSRDSLINQLEFDGYTHDQAVYGVESNGY